MTTTFARPNGGAVLEVRGLTVSFPTTRGVVRAVRGVDFDVRAGQILGVVGESGSGKSVTARAVMRMIREPGVIDAGSVRLRGRDLLTLNERQVREVRGKQIAMVFQDPQAALNPVMRVGEQIAEALVVHGATRSEARRRATELLRQVGIPDVERTIDYYPHEFSGGMRQRVVIAIALANKPSLLIADEPTTALDVTIQAQILQLLAELRDQLGIAVMLITHDMGVVAELCDDVLVMYGGRVVEHGAAAALFANPRHPYTRALLRAVPRITRSPDESLDAIPGAPPDLANLPTGCSFAPRCAFALDRCRHDEPLLVEVAPQRSAACWVSAAGGALELPAPVTAARPGATASADEPVLRVENLRTNVARRGGLFDKHPPVWAVNGVSLELRPGETLGLVGESGCGKSTLSRTIVGITKPAHGTITVAGNDVTAMTNTDLRMVTSTIQYVFQDPYASLNPRRTIRQSIHEALQQAGVTGAEADRRARSLIDRVGLLPDHLSRYPAGLSGGQRQRVGIARALAAEPKLIILDEPVSALDVSIQAQIINLLRVLRDEFGLGYLFIAHDLAIVRHLSDRVAVMYLGHIVETGTVQQVYDEPQHPYTAALLSSTPEPDVHARARERIVLSGDLPSPASPPSGCPFHTRCPIGPLRHPERVDCLTTRPELRRTTAGQLAACHYPGELAPANVIPPASTAHRATRRGG